MADIPKKRKRCAQIKSVSVSTYNTKEGLTHKNPVNGQPVVATIIWEWDNDFIDSLAGDNSVVTYKSYLSKDETLSSDDALVNGNGKIGATSFVPRNGAWCAQTIDSIPDKTEEGTYYYLFQRTNGDVSKGDVTVSPAFKVEKFHSLGTFKVYNSWGKTWGKDGYYYIPFEKAVDMNLLTYFIANRTDVVYDPLLVATFQVTSPGNMQEYNTYFTLENSTEILATKYFAMEASFQKNFLPYSPFAEGTTYTCDLTEFCDSIDRTSSENYMIVLHVDPVIDEKGSSADAATLQNLSVSVYNEGYDHTASHQYDNSTSTTTDKKVTIAIEDLPGTEITRTDKLDRAITLDGGNVYAVARTMTDAEKREINNSIVETPVVVDGHGTGLIRAKDLSAYDNATYLEPTISDTEARSLLMSKSLAASIDLSSDKKYFPPCGNQGNVGSCVAFATTYYALTHEMAKEQKWDLTNANFYDESEKEGADRDEKNWYVTPDANIMSPAFTYNLGNGGVTGMAYGAALEIITRIGCCTWSKMETLDLYGQDDGKNLHERPQPSSEAYAEAAKYRLADFVGTQYSHCSSMGSILTVIKSLQADHCIILAIDSNLYKGTFNQNSVMVGDYPKTDSNHAQTIVGYVTGEEYEKLLNQ